jgi:hypothetical protein
LYNLHPAFSISPTPSKVGDTVKVRYHGFLSEAGADQIFLHTGYGFGSWQSIYDYPMEKKDNEWEKSIKIDRKGQFNFCFKDSAANWDNNNGMNWSYTIKG